MLLALQVDDELIRFYDYCPKCASIIFTHFLVPRYIEEVINGEKAFVQTFKLVQSQLWQDMQTRVIT